MTTFNRPLADENGKPTFNMQSKLGQIWYDGQHPSNL